MSRLGNLTASLRGLRSERTGSTAVEFALIGPAMILVLLAVVQIGMQIQNYNAVRNLASDGSRFATVEYQKGTRSTTDAIETWMRAKGVGGAYNLDTDRLQVTVTEAAASRLTGLVEMNIAVSYDAPEYLWSVAGNVLTISYTRAVFLPPA
jgi:Flp pilus assembly protein TadG